MDNEEIEKVSAQIHKDLHPLCNGKHFDIYRYADVAKWHLEQVASLTARLAEAEKDGKRLEYVFGLIAHTDYAIDRKAIDAAMEGGK